jgi:hypothetical protein
LSQLINYVSLFIGLITWLRKVFTIDLKIDHVEIGIARIENWFTIPFPYELDTMKKSSSLGCVPLVVSRALGIGPFLPQKRMCSVQACLVLNMCKCAGPLLPSHKQGMIRAHEPWVGIADMFVIPFTVVGSSAGIFSVDEWNG